MYPISGAPHNNARSGRGPTGPETGPSASHAHARQNNFTPHTGARKLVVRNLRKEPRLDQDSYFDKVWAQLDAALTAIFDNKTPDNSLEELYKGGENVCRQDRADLLAKNLRRRCKDFVDGKMRQSLLEKAKSTSDVDTLRAVMEAWDSWHSKLVRKKKRSLFKFISPLTTASDHYTMDVLLSRPVISPTFERSANDS
jgi:hypothetical protein